MKTLHSLIAGLWPASSTLARKLAFPLLLLGAGMALVKACAAAPFEFEETGSLAYPVVAQTATLLTDGKVLVAGGTDVHFNNLARTELYDPAKGIWVATVNLATARAHHAATLLPNGKVLVSGGQKGGAILASAELYDPATGT